MTIREASKGVVTSGRGTYNIGFNDGDETQFDVQNLEELQTRCNLTELQAVNIINGFHIPDYVRIAEVRAAKEAEEHEN